MVCPACGGDARFKGYDSKTVTGLVGSLEYRRAYYHCDACHHGWHPTDAELPLETSRTRGAQEVIALAGVQEAFAECAERVLHRLSGLVVSASTVQRVTEAAGQTVAERRAADEPIGSAEAWNWPKDAEGRKIAYVSLDATGVPQQGAHGERTEGRMAWVGSVFAPVPLEASAKPRLRHVRYVSGLMSLEAIGRQLRRECQQVGVERAEVTICLTDGGNGLEACLAETVLAGLSQQTVTILDFYHCAERLSEFVALWVGPERAETESAAWRHRLKPKEAQRSCTSWKRSTWPAPHPPSAKPIVSSAATRGAISIGPTILRIRPAAGKSAPAKSSRPAKPSSANA
jgi:hypothetical protein